MTALNTMSIFCMCDTIYASAYSGKEYRSPPLSKHLPTPLHGLYIISHEACTIPFEIAALKLGNIFMLASISTVFRYLLNVDAKIYLSQKNLKNKNTTYIDTYV